jgi:AbrB family looped-hinge helix DNA binding protein
MLKFNTIISNNGRVVIPASIRKELQLKSGDELIVTLSNEKDIIFHSPRQSLQKLQNIFKSKNKKNLVDEFINMRRKEEI